MNEAKQRKAEKSKQWNFFETAAIIKKEADEGERKMRIAGSSVGVAPEVKRKERLDGDSISVLDSKMSPLKVVFKGEGLPSTIQTAKIGTPAAHNLRGSTTKVGYNYRGDSYTVPTGNQFSSIFTLHISKCQNFGSLYKYLLQS